MRLKKTESVEDRRKSLYNVAPNPPKPIPIQSSILALTLALFNAIGLTFPYPLATGAHQFMYKLLLIVGMDMHI